MIAERILAAFCFFDGDTNPSAAKYKSNPLRTLRREYPALTQIVKGKRVLDFGCGTGEQSAALTELGAIVTALDTNTSTLEKARTLQPHVEFVSQVEGRQFDVIISQNAMEHFTDPVATLAQMKARLAPGGKILITFGPPWYAPWGSHMGYFCRVPWVQLMFPERVVMNLRQRHPAIRDKALRYEEVESGLNRMSVAKFERLIRQLGMRVERRAYRTVAGLPLVGSVPILRELLINHITVELSSDV